MSEQTPDPTIEIQRKATWRMGQKQRERLQWTMVAIICVLLFFALRPTYIYIVQRRDFQTCQSNTLQIAEGLQRYAADWDETLPGGDVWMNNIEGNLSPRTGTGFSVKDIFHCPLDKTGAPSSYAYNSALAGYSAAVKSTDAAIEEVRKKLGRADRAALVFEKHGSQRNASELVMNWDALGKALTRPHQVPGPTGTVITGNIKPGSVDEERLLSKQGDRF